MSQATTGNKYKRIIYSRTHQGASVEVDVYCVLKAFNVTNPAVAHAVKKLLCPGQREKGGVLQDLTEAKDAIFRAIEMEQETGTQTLSQQIRRIPDKELKEMLDRIESGPSSLGYPGSPTAPPFSVGTITRGTITLPKVDNKGRVNVVPPNVFICQDVNGEFFYHDPITKLPTPAYVFQKPNEP